MEKAESLRVTRGDFFASLENDIKPVSGHCGAAGTATVQSVMGGSRWDPLGSLSIAASWAGMSCAVKVGSSELCVPVAAWRVIKRTKTDKEQLGVSSPCHSFPF